MSIIEAERPSSTTYYTPASTSLSYQQQQHTAEYLQNCRPPPNTTDETDNSHSHPMQTPQPLSTTSVFDARSVGSRPAALNTNRTYDDSPHSASRRKSSFFCPLRPGLTDGGQQQHFLSKSSLGGSSSRSSRSSRQSKCRRHRRSQTCRKRPPPQRIKLLTASSFLFHNTGFFEDGFSMSNYFFDNNNGNNNNNLYFAFGSFVRKSWWKLLMMVSLLSSGLIFRSTGHAEIIIQPDVNNAQSSQTPQANPLPPKHITSMPPNPVAIDEPADTDIPSTNTLASQIPILNDVLNAADKSRPPNAIAGSLEKNAQKKDENSGDRQSESSGSSTQSESSDNKKLSRSHTDHQKDTTDQKDASSSPPTVVSTDQKDGSAVTDAAVNGTDVTSDQKDSNNDDNDDDEDDNEPPIEEYDKFIQTKMEEKQLELRKQNVIVVNSDGHSKVIDPTTINNQQQQHQHQSNNVLTPAASSGAGVGGNRQAGINGASPDSNGGAHDSSGSEQQQSGQASAAEQVIELQQTQRNYASQECGAKVLLTNPECKQAKAVLDEKERDQYMLNPCEVAGGKFLIIELCEILDPTRIDIANFELFSSSPKDMMVWGSERYPSSEWTMLGNWTAEDKRVIQSFPVTLPVKTYVKFLKVELLSHYGSEHFCPLSLIRAIGVSISDEIELEARPQVPSAPAATAAPPITPPAATTPKPSSQDSPAENTDESNDTAASNILTKAKNLVNGVVSKILGSPEIVSTNARKAINGTGNTGNCTLNGPNNHLWFRKCSITPIADWHLCYYFLSPNPFARRSVLAAIEARTPNETVDLDLELNLTKLNMSTSPSTFQQPKSPPVKSSTADHSHSSSIDGTSRLSSNGGKEGGENGENGDHPDTSSMIPDSFHRHHFQHDFNKSPVTFRIPKIERFKALIHQLRRDAAERQKQQAAAETNPGPIIPPSVPAAQIHVIKITNDTLLNREAVVLPGHQSPGKESLLIRLNNRIRALELNISLSSQYLSELSRRYRKTLDDIQKQYNRTMRQVNETARRSEEGISATRDEVQALRLQLTQLTQQNTLFREHQIYLQEEFWKFFAVIFGLGMAGTLFFVWLCFGIGSNSHRANKSVGGDGNQNEVNNGEELAEIKRRLVSINEALLMTGGGHVVGNGEVVGMTRGSGSNHQHVAAGDRGQMSHSMASSTTSTAASRASTPGSSDTSHPPQQQTEYSFHPHPSYYHQQQQQHYGIAAAGGGNPPNADDEPIPLIVIKSEPVKTSYDENHRRQLVVQPSSSATIISSNAVIGGMSMSSLEGSSRRSSSELQTTADNNQQYPGDQRLVKTETESVSLVQQQRRPLPSPVINSLDSSRPQNLHKNGPATKSNRKQQRQTAFKSIKSTSSSSGGTAVQEDQNRPHLHHKPATPSSSSAAPSSYNNGSGPLSNFSFSVKPEPDAEQAQARPPSKKSKKLAAFRNNDVTGGDGGSKKEKPPVKTKNMFGLLKTSPEKEVSSKK